MLICDFCSQQNVEWSFPALSFVYKHLPIAESAGAWAACTVCKDLIEANDRAGLAIRCAEADPFLHELIPMEDLIAMATELHIQFFANRIGPAKPFNT